MVEKYKHRCELRLSFNSSESAESFSKSMNASMKNRGISDFNVDNNIAVININTRDIVALRALINSTLRVASVVESLDKENL